MNERYNESKERFDSLLEKRDTLKKEYEAESDGEKKAKLKKDYDLAIESYEKEDTAYKALGT